MKTSRLIGTIYSVWETTQLVDFNKDIWNGATSHLISSTPLGQQITHIAFSHINVSLHSEAC